MNRLTGKTIYYPTDHDDHNRFSQSRRNILKNKKTNYQLTLTITIPKEGKNEQQTIKENLLFHFNFLTKKTNKQTSLRSNSNVELQPC